MKTHPEDPHGESVAVRVLVGRVDCIGRRGAGGWDSRSSPFA